MIDWTLYEGDCLTILPRLPAGSVDAVITDPPYAMAGSVSNGRHALADDQFFGHWFADVWAAAARVCSPAGHAFVFCDWRTIGVMAKAIDRTDWRATQALVWDRDGLGMGVPFRATYEMILYARGPEAARLPVGTVATNIVRERWPYGRKTFHPAEKPVALLRRLVRWSGARTILDPFAGSGSTIIAALMEGRSCIAIEREASYCDVARRRLTSIQAALPVGNSSPQREARSP